MVNSNCGPKLIHLIDKYDLDGIIADLESKWTRNDEDSRYSIRDLESYFNTAIVNSVFNQIGAVPAEYTAENVYEILSSDDDKLADEAFLRTWFEERGIDPDELADDFISYYPIYVYLRGERDVESPNTQKHSPEEKKQRSIDRMDRLKSRVEKVCEKTISSLQRADVIPDTDLSVRILFQLECPDCRTRSSIMTYIYNEKCPVCSDSEELPPEKEINALRDNS